jgi:hypothetical protein
MLQRRCYVYKMKVFDFLLLEEEVTCGQDEYEEGATIPFAYHGI